VKGTKREVIAELYQDFSSLCSASDKAKTTSTRLLSIAENILQTGCPVQPLQRKFKEGRNRLAEKAVGGL